MDRFESLESKRNIVPARSCGWRSSSKPLGGVVQRSLLLPQPEGLEFVEHPVRLRSPAGCLEPGRDDSDYLLIQ